MSQTTVTLFGIPNCDTVKKSRQWFADQGITVAFHDFKKQGLDAAVLASWVEVVGIDTLLNRRGTTWRQLSAAEQAGADDIATAQTLLLQHTSLIKRPVVAFHSGNATAASGASGTPITVGFVPQEWAKLLA